MGRRQYTITNLILFIGSLFALSFTVQAKAQNMNQIPVYMDKVKTNSPMVSITICEPGTNHCQTINRISLDTGSIGLRLNASVLKLKLPYVTNQQGGHVDECVDFGGGSTYAGPIQYADVRVGGLVAKKLRIQFYNDKVDLGGQGGYGGCESTATSNGILGIGPLDKYECPSSVGSCPTYFLCKEGSLECSPLSQLPPHVALDNPIYNLESNNNGFMLSFPKLNQPINGPITGKLTFGVGFQQDNSIPKKDQIFGLNKGGFLPVVFPNQLHSTLLFDTGVMDYFFPANPGNVTPCDNNSPLLYLLCPTKPVNVSLQIGATSPYRSISMVLGNPHPRLTLNPYLAVVVRRYNATLLGMPYFYGHQIYFGLPDVSGKKYPNGFVAIHM